MSKKDTSLLNSCLPNGSPFTGGNWLIGTEKKSSLSSVKWNQTNDKLLLNDMFHTLHNGHDSADISSPLLEKAHELRSFASSLPALLHKKLNLGSSIEWTESLRDQVVAEEPLDQEIVARAIGDILPNEDELLSGLSTGFLTNMTEDIEDIDLFSSGGGLEMDSEPQEGFSTYRNSSKSLDGLSGVNFHGLPLSGSGSVIGEHPYGEHPSRTLFVRNINSNVEDSELRSLFEQYGDIRTLYTACKHRGFVMISYYDIRAARSAMRALQNKPLRRRKLDIHFSIPKDNPSDKDVNQGTLVVFNLDASVSNDDLRHIFGQYGEVKEIRETPHKRHHKFIEFYDVRAAEAALRALNRSDIAGKRIKLEPSRPGGARRSLIQQINQDTEQEDMRLYWQQSSPPIMNSPPGAFSSWGYVGSPGDNGLHRSLLHSLGTSVPSTNKNLLNLPISRVGTIGSHLGRSNQIDAGVSSVQSGFGIKGLPHHAQSLPEYSNGMTPFYDSSIMATMRDASKGPDIENSRISKTCSEASLFEHAPGGLGMSSSHGLNSVSVGNASLSGLNTFSVGNASLPGLSTLSVGNGSLSGLNALSVGNTSLYGVNAVSVGKASLSGPQFLWGNSSHFQQNNSSMGWSSSSVGPNVSVGHMQSHAYGRATNHPQYINGSLHSQGHHVGSAPADSSFLDKLAYVCESPDVSSYNPSLVYPRNIPGTGSKVLGHGTTHSTIGTNVFIESGTSPNLGVISPHYRSSMFHPSGILLSSYFDMAGVDRGRIRRTESNASQGDNKKQYQLDIDRISRGDDKRTTLMIKNIPNKYTSKMLLAAIDENHKGMYDFLYLPIDFKNKCNVGYAFINMTSPEYIVSLYQSFNGKKWEKFNSEKVVSLAYARIQGKAALVAHFQNSSLMNEDKRCRPILLNSDGPENNEQEPMYLEIGTRPYVVSEPTGVVDTSHGGYSTAINSNSPENN